MTKKKNSAARKRAPTPTPPPAPSRNGSRMAIWAVAAVVAVLALVGIMSASGKWGTGGATATAGISPEEAKYLGRLLPKGYQGPKVAEVAVYSSTVNMTDITAKDEGRSISIPVGDVTSNKIVKFTYARSGGQAIPLLAYIKPSGKLFVAVSFCPPCEGEGQRIEPDGTLVCESCGTKRDLETSVGISGACKLYPLDELPVTVASDRISLDKAVLDTWTSQPKDRPIGG